MAKEHFNYFETLKKQGDYAVREADMLVGILNQFDPAKLPEQVEQMHELETAADEQIHQIYTRLAREFITPIDREDIMQMAQRLDDIVDYVEDVLRLIYLYNVQSIYIKAIPMVHLMQRTTGALSIALEEFHNFKKSGDLEKRLIEINDLEEEADKLYSEALLDLYRNYTDEPVFIMVWSALLSRMERCSDACENVADMMSTIILKNN